MSKMSQLHSLMVEIVCSCINDESAIELMVEEGLPREACASILWTFKEHVFSELEAVE